MTTKPPPHPYIGWLSVKLIISNDGIEGYSVSAYPMLTEANDTSEYRDYIDHHYYICGALWKARSQYLSHRVIDAPVSTIMI